MNIIIFFLINNALFPNLIFGKKDQLNLTNLIKNITKLKINVNNEKRHF